MRLKEWILGLRSRAGIRLKFIVAVGVCLPVVAAVGIQGLIGLSSVRDQATSLYEGQFTRTRSTAQLLAELGSLGSMVIDPAMSDPANRRRVRRQFASVDRPRIERRVHRLLAGSLSPAVSREVGRLDRAADQLLRLYGRAFGSARVDVRALSGLALPLATLGKVASRLMNLERAAAAHVHARLQVAHENAARRLVAAMVAALVLMLVAAGALAHDLITRILVYSRFGVSAAEGSNRRLSVTGYDELSDLGRAIDRMAAASLETRAHHDREEQLTHALELTDGEDDAHELLCRHIERSLPGTEATVLKRGASGEAIELIRAHQGAGPHERLAGAPSRDCLAMRLGRQHEHSPNGEELLPCRLCGKGPGESTCTPFVVGGEVLGSVLVCHKTPPDAGARAAIGDSVARAAPALANLRNLALVEMRAATDALTGLPNTRALQEALVRMTAQASRAGTELAAVLLDVDHFKQVNDTYGHAAGDHLLTAVGALLPSSLRAGDFVGRYGGEEFLLLLPDTGREGGAVIAEKVRTAISRISVPGVDRPITASLGVASLPADANDGEALLRAADRAMYAAKAAGRNRVELFDQPKAAGPVRPDAGAHLAA